MSVSTERNATLGRVGAVSPSQGRTIGSWLFHIGLSKASGAKPHAAAGPANNIESHIVEL